MNSAHRNLGDNCGDCKPQIQQEALDGPQGLVVVVPKQATRTEEGGRNASTVYSVCLQGLNASPEVLRG